MCLDLSQIKNKPRKVFNTSWYEALKKNGKITCYKILDKIKGNLESPYYPMPYQPGWNKSNRKMVDISDKNINCMFVSRGIHVYRNKREAGRKAAKLTVFYNNNYVVVPVTCYLKDLVAMGKYSEAVFMKVFLKKTDHDNAIN